MRASCNIKSSTWNYCFPMNENNVFSRSFYCLLHCSRKRRIMTLRRYIDVIEKLILKIIQELMQIAVQLTRRCEIKVT